LVRQRTNDKNVRIEVIDKGEGIRKSDLPYIRDRYYKVDKNHKRPIMGTGLGLSIVKKIIEMHDGTYGVETEEGKGSLFWFEIQIEQ
jgi:signal transduction histidine kinase